MVLSSIVLTLACATPSAAQAPPRVSLVDSVVSTGGAELVAGRITDGPLTQLLVSFDKAMTAATVETSTSYLLIRVDLDRMPETTFCSPFISVHEHPVPPSSVTYDPVARTVIFRFNDALPAGHYRFFACSTIEDEDGRSLDGDGNGVGGDDFSRDFTVRLTDQLTNPNFDTDLSGWDTTSANPAEVAHDTADLDGAPTSGSVQWVNLTGVDATFELSQCISASPPDFLQARGAVRIDAGVSGSPRLLVLIETYDGADCSGNVVATGGATLVQGDTAGAWQLFAAEGWRVEAQTVSARVVFQLDANGDGQVEAYLDALLGGNDPSVFADGFETGDTGAWSDTAGRVTFDLHYRETNDRNFGARSAAARGAAGQPPGRVAARRGTAAGGLPGISRKEGARIGI